MALDSERSKVAHLLRRASFGSTEAELDEYAALGFAGALDRLLNYEQVDNSALEQQLPGLQLDFTKIEDGKFWWLYRMLHTRRPLQEKMALFWHTHFATANSKVGNPPLMLRQLQLFHEHALDSFEVLLQKVLRDPAMLIWLDNRLNRKGNPNENFAREVMELFTVGLGNYTEADIKEAARAFSGYTLDQEKRFVFNPRAHDAGPKTFFGETRNWDADDVLAALVRQPATARFLSAKLFRFFVYGSPDQATLDRLAETFVTSDFSTRAVVRAILSGPEFLSPQAYHALAKQPVELVVGTLKALDVANVGRDVTQFARRMGQDLLNPPDVSGWKGGERWINAATLFERFNFANRLATGRDPAKPYFADVAAQVQSKGLSSAEALVDYYTGLLVDGDLTPEARQALLDYLAPDGAFVVDERSIDARVRGLVHLVMALPTYQLA
ncbi:MAG: DUF1800 domain-containing protein [Chloroflexi bacterium]|nr:DUF1800 domain-containing protein [Chloroflexota bacterium]